MGPPCSAAAALGAHVAEAWAVACDLVDCLAQAPAMEEECGKQHETCGQLLLSVATSREGWLHSLGRVGR